MIHAGVVSRFGYNTDAAYVKQEQFKRMLDREAAAIREIVFDEYSHLAS